MEQRALLAFLISLAIVFGYQALFAPVPQHVDQGPTQPLAEPERQRPVADQPGLDLPAVCWSRGRRISRCGQSGAPVSGNRRWPRSNGGA